MANDTTHGFPLWGDTAGSRLLLQAVPGCAALLNGRGVVEAVNAAWIQAQGDNPFLAGLAPGADYLAHCQVLAKGAELNHALVAASIVSTLQGKIRRIKLEYPVRGEAGTRWYSMAATAPEADEPEFGVVVAHTEITERMAWENRVRRNEHLFKATTENALDLIAVIGADGRTVYASPSYGTTLGYAGPILAGRKLLDLVCPDDQPGFRENCRIGLSSGMSPLFEYSVLHQDGQARQLEARAVAVDNPGGERDAILLISRDISAKKEAERERVRMEAQLRHAQKMEAVGQLAAGIAHEINTPCQYLSDNMRFLQESFASFARITACLGPALERPEGRGELERVAAEEDIGYLNAEVPQAIQQSLDGLARISTIVQAMKVFGHPGGDERVAVNLNETLRNTIVVAQGEWKYVAEVVTELDPQLPEILGSAGEMNQVFLNLLVNAAHAIAERTPAGPEAKGRITISTSAEAGWVEVRVRDTGTGIPEAIRGQVFLPFFTTKPVGKGTGQGLAIAHSVITKNGGTIDFASEPGRGTCFMVRLPVKA